MKMKIAPGFVQKPPLQLPEKPYNARKSKETMILICMGAKMNECIDTERRSIL